MAIQFTQESMDRGTNQIQGRLTAAAPDGDSGGDRRVHCVDVGVRGPHLATTLHLITHGAGQTPGDRRQSNWTNKRATMMRVRDQTEINRNKNNPSKAGFLTGKIN
jgi:hypothetical protein